MRKVPYKEVLRFLIRNKNIRVYLNHFRLSLCRLISQFQEPTPEQPHFSDPGLFNHHRQHSKVAFLVLPYTEHRWPTWVPRRDIGVSIPRLTHLKLLPAKSTDRRRYSCC